MPHSNGCARSRQGAQRRGGRGAIRCDLRRRRACAICGRRREDGRRTGRRGYRCRCLEAGVAMSRLGLSIAASLAIVLALFASASPVDAWARMGHRIIGLIARDQLSPEAKAAVRQLMGSDDLPKFSLYLDLIKDDLQQQIPGSRAWHYDNVPVCKTKARDQYCHAGNCASGQIARHHQLLRDAQ
ncbi:MAG: hypothetical protein DMD83_05815, partial [Candidatus Rokuibacteriota bacterium]